MKFIELVSEDNQAKTLEDICAHVSNGGSIIDLCKLWAIRWSDLHRWLISDEERKKRYYLAVEAQGEWSVQRVLTELKSISFSDIRQIFGDNHELKPVSEWPEEIARMLSGIEVDELKEDGIKIGLIKKVKLVDKIRAIELMMKNMNMLTDRTLNLHGTTDDKKFRDEFFGVKS